MYVFGKDRRNLVSVDEGSECYYVKCEWPDRKGSYYIVEYPKKSLDIEMKQDIAIAVDKLKWMQDGNEFPT